MSSTYRKPLPVITKLNEPFWTALHDHELRVQRCDACEAWIWPISVCCQQCGSRSITWTVTSGRARLSTWIVYHNAFHPAFADDVPYHVAEIELDEGPRFQATIVDASVSEFTAGMPLEACYDDVTPEITLVRFRVAGSA